MLRETAPQATKAKAWRKQQRRNNRRQKQSPRCYYLGHYITKLLFHPTEATLLRWQRAHPKNRFQVHPFPLYLIQGVQSVVQYTKLNLQRDNEEVVTFLFTDWEGSLVGALSTVFTSNRRYVKRPHALLYLPRQHHVPKRVLRVSWGGRTRDKASLSRGELQTL